MMKTAGMPVMFWGEAVMTAVYLLNQSLTSNLEGRMPYEVWHGIKPTVHHLRTFRCVVYTKVTQLHLEKFDDRGQKGIFIGYEVGSKAYRVYYLVEGHVHVSRDIAFDKNTFWNWDIDGDKEQNTESFSVDFTYIEPEDGAARAPAL
jgi:hypothetical protein